MWWLWILLVLLVLVLAYLLWAPFFIEIDSEAGIYRVRFHRLAVARVWIKEDSIWLQWKIAAWGKTIDLLDPGEVKPPVKHAKRRKRRTEKRKRAIPWRKIKAVFQSFRVKKFEFDIDTGDIPANGILYPVVWGLSRWSGRKLSVNFEDRNEMVLMVKNNFARVIWAFWLGK
jgi:hypothetical protein